MCIVGYGDSEDNYKFFELKNSYGRNWGIHGYMRIRRTDPGLCKITEEAYVPLIKGVKPPDIAYLVKAGFLSPAFYRRRAPRIDRRHRDFKPVSSLSFAEKQKPNCRKLTTKDPTQYEYIFLSKKRYKADEISPLEVMKDKFAMTGNPYTRPALRFEAQRRIGDTKMIDHLLKHVPNFRRLHKGLGAVEYWLDNSDFVGIRKDGVKDPEKDKVIISNQKIILSNQQGYYI